MGDSEAALPCTLAKQATCYRETIACSDASCQKAKMKDAFPPLPYCFHRTYLSHLSIWESVSPVTSQDPTCQMSPVSEIFIHTPSPIFHSSVKR